MASVRENRMKNGALGRLHGNCRKNIVCIKPSV